MREREKAHARALSHSITFTSPPRRPPPSLPTTHFQEIDSWLQDANKETPFFWGHGGSDPIVQPVMQVTGTELLRSKGINVDAQVYPGMPHSFCQKEEQHVLEFIATRLGCEAK